MKSQLRRLKTTINHQQYNHLDNHFSPVSSDFDRIRLVTTTAGKEGVLEIPSASARSKWLLYR